VITAKHANAACPFCDKGAIYSLGFLRQAMMARQAPLLVSKGRADKSGH